ncbi:MAG: DUF4397 domain-containing protein [Burkholderiales bacterium]|nr:DUF4397 domain-containing protein [Burkholderiales bacterium]
MQRRSFIKLMATNAVALGAASTLSACKLKGGGSSNSIQPNMRFINLALGQPTLNISLSVPSSFSTLPFQQNSGYQSVNWSGSQTVTLSDANNNTLSTFTLAPNQSAHYTTYVYNTSAGVQHYTEQTDAYTVDSGKFVVRTFATTTIGSASGATPSTFDVYLTGANDDITPTGYAPTVSGTSGAPTAYSVEQTAGSFRIRVTQASTKNVVFDSGSTNLIAFNSQGAYTILLYSVGSAWLPTLMLVQPTSDTVTILNNSLARIRVLQGTPDVTLSRFSVDSTKILVNAAFGTSTTYQQQPAGAHSLVFGDDTAGQGVPFCTVPAASSTLVGGTDYTVISSGLKAAATGLIFSDLYQPSPVADLKVRFVNATQDQASVDVILNNSPLTGVTGLKAGNASANQDLNGAIDNKVAFVIGGTVTQLGAQLDMGTLSAGGQYTVALIGANGNYQTVMLQPS